MNFDQQSTREQLNQQLLTIYYNMYYTTHNQITSLTFTLQDIKHSIDQLLIYNNNSNNNNINIGMPHATNPHHSTSTHTPTPTPTRRRTRREDSQRELSQILNSVFESIPIAPSHQQISQAIRELSFSDIDNPLNTQCPISLVDFQPEQRVSQIIQCGHVIETQNLNRWLRSHASCPVCRLDIRTTIPIPIPITQTLLQTQTQTQSPSTNQSQTTTIELGVTGIEDLLRALANLS